MTRGLFDVDVFAGLTSPNGRQRVPVIGQRQRYGIHVFGLEQGAHVGVLFGLIAFQLLDCCHGSLAGGLVDIAQGCDARIGIQRRIVFDMVGTAAPQAHNADIDSIVSAENGELGCGNGCGGCFHELSSGWLRLHGVLQRAILSQTGCG